MNHSQSNLTSLAALVEEARRTAIPPAPAQPAVDDGSGMIDLKAMEKKAREDRERSVAERAATPLPVVKTVPPVALPSIPPAASDPDVFAAMVAAQQRKKTLAIGGAVAALAVLLAIGLGSVFSGASDADTAKAAAAAAAPPPAPPAAPTPTFTPPAAPVAPALASAVAVAPAPVEDPAPSKAKPGKKKKARKHSGSKGPKLQKVQSAGT